MWVNDIRHGEGTMRWFDKNQVYTGQWENGIQVRLNGNFLIVLKCIINFDWFALKNGLGEHSWYLARIDMTQYCLRNTYYGSFKNGKRDGQGTFLYADGSKYEGMWKENQKNGWVCLNIFNINSRDYELYNFLMDKGKIYIKRRNSFRIRFWRR